MALMAPATSIDWQQPWLAPLRHVGECVVARQRSGMSLPDALNLDGAPRRFVPHEALPEGEPYESYIARSAQVPTRENLHDFFNGLVWHAEPALKSRLNQLQAQAIGRDGIGPRRGALRDALTLFDENGALLDGPDALQQALRQRDWQQLLVHQRALWREARLRIVGHALLAQLSVAPRKGLTAHVWVGDALGAAAENLARQTLSAAAGAGRARLVAGESSAGLLWRCRGVPRPARETLGPGRFGGFARLKPLKAAGSP